MTPLEASKKHRGVPLYEISAYCINNMNLESQSKITREMYLTFDEALKAARQQAEDSAWASNIPGFGKFIELVLIYFGRKFSKEGNIYGFPKVVYVISTGTKEETESEDMDKRFKKYPINEYTTQPTLSEDMFYQWDD